jgi:hypothetical protein
MSTNNHNTSWEQLLKEQADDFRMPPSPKSWELISKQVRIKRRLPSFSLVAILLLIFFLIKPLNSKRISKMENIDGYKHIGVTQKKAIPIPKG